MLQIAYIAFNIYVVKENIIININEIKPYLTSSVNDILLHVSIFIIALKMSIIIAVILRSNIVEILLFCCRQLEVLGVCLVSHLNI